MTIDLLIQGDCLIWFHLIQVQLYAEANFALKVFLSLQLKPNEPEETEQRKAYGGHKKIKAVQVNRGIYAWNSLGILL